MFRRSRVVITFAAIIVSGTLAGFAVRGGFGGHSVPSASISAAPEDQSAPDIVAETPPPPVDVNRLLQDKPDPIAWSGPGGVVVYVAKDDWRRVMQASVERRSPVMVPARDASGRVVGYAATDVEIIPAAVAEAPGFDLAAYQAAEIENDRQALLNDPEASKKLRDRTR